MFEVLSGDSDVYQSGDVVAVAEMAARYDVCVIGPGLGTESTTAEFLVGLINSLKARSARVIVDADALNLLATSAVTLKGLSAIVTPHPGEAARLLGITNAQVQRDRFTACRQIALQMQAISVLKGAGTLIHDGEEGKVVAEGTTYLATPGSGDVLAGIIAACAVRTRSLWEAAILGVWLHARAGMAAADKRGGPILASEIAEQVGELLGRFSDCNPATG
jgi:NAD(P)H-hydrate epimerase